MYDFFKWMGNNAVVDTLFIDLKGLDHINTNKDQVDPMEIFKIRISSKAHYLSNIPSLTLSSFYGITFAYSDTMYAEKVKGRQLKLVYPLNFTIPNS